MTPEGTKAVRHEVTCKLFPDPFDEREPVGPCTCGAMIADKPAERKYCSGCSFRVLLRKDGKFPRHYQRKIQRADRFRNMPLCKNSNTIPQDHST